MMRMQESADLFYNTFIQKASQHDFIQEPTLTRKWKDPNYRSFLPWMEIQAMQMHTILTLQKKTQYYITLQQQ